jgi:hypothetical protein
MNQSVISQIEATFGKLSFPEQLLVIERLVHQMQQNTLTPGNDLDSQLALMAADSEIQNELKNIEKEFAYTEADGLENL